MRSPKYCCTALVVSVAARERRGGGVDDCFRADWLDGASFLLPWVGRLSSILMYQLRIWKCVESNIAKSNV